MSSTPSRPSSRTLAFLLSLSVLAAGCGGDDASPTSPSEPDPQLDRIEVSPDNAELSAEGDTAHFEAAAFDEDGNEMSGVDFTWSSSDTTVATVNSDGVATARGEGTIDIEASAKGVTGASTLGVQFARLRITQPQSDTTAQEGESLTFSGEGEHPDGDPISPDELEWSSDVQGDLGTGETVEVDSLVLDTHWVIVRATDAEGNELADSLSVVIEMRPERVDRPTTDADTAAGFMTGQIILNYEDDAVADSTIAAINREYGLESQRAVGGNVDDFAAFIGENVDAETTRQVAADLNGDSRVQYAAVNPIVRPDEFPSDWDSTGSVQEKLHRVGVDLFWKRLLEKGVSRPGSGIDIAIIDTGVDTDHEEFSAGESPKIKNPARVRYFSDAKRGLNEAEDSDGHGTMAASIAGGSGWDDNGNEFVGVAPAATIIPIKITGGIADEVAGIKVKKAIRYAIDADAEVINLSWGMPPSLGSVGRIMLTEVMRDALDQGIHIVVSSGNCGNDFSSVNGYAQADDRLIVVGGTNLDGTDIFSGISTSDCDGNARSQGGKALDVVAPGRRVARAEVGGGISSGFGTFGTSIAAPVVSGLVALHLDSGVAPEDVLGVITGQTVDLGPTGWDEDTGAGRVIGGVELTEELDPSTVSAGENTTITATGRNFDRESTVIVDGERVDPVEVRSHEELTFEVAPPSPGTFDVSIEHPSGLNSNSKSLTVTEEPARIVFTSERNGNVDVFRIDEDGSSLTRLTTSPATDLATDVSPDGEEVLFVTDRDGNPEIYRMNIDGSGRTRLTNSTALDSFPRWSPDGGEVAFSSERAGDDGREIYVMARDGTNVRNITDDAIDGSQPAWSSTGEIAFVSLQDGDRDVWVMDTDGGNRENLTNGSFFRSVLPDWSPDGSNIVFQARTESGKEIYKMSSSGTNMTALTSNSVADSTPRWSPQGEEVVFASDRTGGFELFLMNTDGTNVRQVTNNSYLDLYPVWVP